MSTTTVNPGPVTYLPVPRGADELTILNPIQVAQVYRVSKEDVYEALREDRLPHHKLGRWNYILIYEELPEVFPTKKYAVA